MSDLYIKSSRPLPTDMVIDLDPISAAISNVFVTAALLFEGVINVQRMQTALQITGDAFPYLFLGFKCHISY